MHISCNVWSWKHSSSSFSFLSKWYHHHLLHQQDPGADSLRKPRQLQFTGRKSENQWRASQRENSGLLQLSVDQCTNVRKYQKLGRTTWNEQRSQCAVLTVSVPTSQTKSTCPSDGKEFAIHQHCSGSAKGILKFQSIKLFPNNYIKLTHMPLKCFLSPSKLHSQGTSCTCITFSC